MKFFKIDVIGAMDPDDCFLESPPEGTDDFTFRMAEGDRVGAKYPPNARIYMDDEHSGIRLTSIIGNTNAFLIVSGDVKRAISASRTGEIEYLAVAIYNHKRRLASRDYFIVNPIGAVDCLDPKQSKIEYLEKDIVAVDEFVFDAEQAAQAPDLFRVREDPRQYFISESLADVLRSLPATNLVLDEIRVAGTKSQKR
jgi:hypothetical protein